MNLSKLFEIQSRLDERIVQEHDLQGQDLLDKKILALQVEVGELANEQRSWKFWSHDQRPRGQDDYLEYRTVDQGGNHWVNKNPLLEEYVDCLHFILSIGLELECTPIACDITIKNVEQDITIQFIGLFDIVNAIRHNHNFYKRERTDMSKNGLSSSYHKLLSIFIGLGEMLGFTWEKIEQAYLDKNKVNHERQNTGY